MMAGGAAPIRLLTAVPICDGHDSAISTINLELIRHGIEVVYFGYHRAADDIARAAVQEDVRAVGISSYNGGHIEFFAALIDRLRKRGGDDIGVFGGGGGTIHHADAAIMRKQGVDRVFFPGTPLLEIVEFVKQTYGGSATRKARSGRNGHTFPDRRISRALTQCVNEKRIAAAKPHRGFVAPWVVGVTGPGGAGKTTLIDELVLRLLKSDDQMRIAVLSHDPSIIGSGALLGDRAAMLYCQNDRVFMRSLATAGRAGGLAPASERCLRFLKNLPERDGGFDVVFVETVGIGQEAVPFDADLVDKTVFVMSPDYGSRLQLQKIAMLDVADVVVVNKSDLAAAQTASSEVQQRLGANGREQQLVCTVAKRHRDAGVDELLRLCGTGVLPMRRDDLATHAPAGVPQP